MNVHPFVVSSFFNLSVWIQAVLLTSTSLPYKAHSTVLTLLNLVFTKHLI